MGKGCEKKARNLILVFGDQLDAGSAAFDGFDTAEDAVLMMEVEEEATYIPQHKIRLTFFFSAGSDTQDVIKLVEGVFPDSPGRLENFDYPNTELPVANKAENDYHKL